MFFELNGQPREAVVRDRKLGPDRAQRRKAEQGTRPPVQPTLDPDPAAIESAVRAGDFTAFRTATQGYEEPLRDRVGRWLERSEATDAQVGRRFTVADVVEEVFLTAFEDYDRWPRAVPFGEWLDELIDGAVQALMRHTDVELENVRFARTLQGVAATREEK